MVDHLLNIPYDSDEALREAVSLYNRIRPDMINCYNLLYFPKSKLIDIAIEAGLLKNEDREKIDRGQSVVYQTGEVVTKTKDYYSRYALLLSAIPLLPKNFVKRIEHDKKLVSFFASFPLFLVPLVKVLLNFRMGRGFLPLAILKMEAFFTSRFITGKFTNLIKTGRV
jgi:hypothetical protein